MIYLRQNDPAWAKARLGMSNCTMEDFGCTTACVSMVSDYFGNFKSPADLASRLKLYTNQGLLNWDKLNDIFLKFDWVWRQHGLNRVRIDESLKDPDKAVIFQVNNGKHWVVALRKSLLGFGKDYVCLDPLTGKKINVLAKYGNITGSSHFQRV